MSDLLAPAREGSSGAASAAPRILTKSDFASYIKRDPAFVTRAIASGKLSGLALVGEGRGTRINVAEALRQLAIKLDLGQQLAQAAPIFPLPSQSSVSPATGAVTVGTVERPASDASALLAGDDLLAEQRAEQVRLRNDKLRAEIERGAREDAVACAQLVDSQAVSRALQRQLGPLVAIFDELPAAIAKPLSEQFGLDYPETLIAVKNAVRRQRHAWAETAASIGRHGAVQVAA